MWLPAGMESVTIAPVSGTAQYWMTQSRARYRYRVVSTTRPSIDDVSTFAPRARITRAVVPAGALARSVMRLVPPVNVSPISVASGAPTGTRGTLRPVKRFEFADIRAVHAGAGVAAPIASRVHSFVDLLSVPSQASLESVCTAYTRALRRG